MTAPLARSRDFITVERNGKFVAEPVRQKHMDIRDWAAQQKKAKPSKYRAKKVEADGYMFDSRAEYRRYLELKTLRDAGKIHTLIVHPGFDLGFCYWKLDNSYIVSISNTFVVEDIKGVKGRDLGIKLKLMREKYAIDVRILDRETDGRLFK